MDPHSAGSAEKEIIINKVILDSKEVLKDKIPAHFICEWHFEERPPFLYFRIPARSRRKAYS
jgi:hypothetical protein